MRNLVTTLIFLHSVSALSSKPNTQARFFETMAKLLTTDTSPHVGLHPHEKTRVSLHCVTIDHYHSQHYHQSIYHHDDTKSQYVPTDFPLVTDNIRDFRAAYDEFASRESEIVPGVFVKSGLNVVKMENYRENDNLYISYDADIGKQLIQNMILARSTNLEPVKLPLLAHVFDQGSLFHALPRELMHVLCASVFFNSPEVMELYRYLYM